MKAPKNLEKNDSAVSFRSGRCKNHLTGRKWLGPCLQQWLVAQNKSLAGLVSFDNDVGRDRIGFFHHLATTIDLGLMGQYQSWCGVLSDQEIIEFHQYNRIANL